MSDPDRTIIVQFPSCWLPGLAAVSEAAATWFAGEPPVYVIPEDTGTALMVCSNERGLAAVVRDPETKLYNTLETKPVAVSGLNEAAGYCVEEPLVYYDVNRCRLEVPLPRDQAPGTLAVLSVGRDAYTRDSWHLAPEEQPEWAEEVTLAFGECRVHEDGPDLRAAPSWLEALDQKRAEASAPTRDVSLSTAYLELLADFDHGARLSLHGLEGTVIATFGDASGCYVALSPLADGWDRHDAGAS